MSGQNNFDRSKDFKDIRAKFESGTLFKKDKATKKKVVMSKLNDFSALREKLHGAFGFGEKSDQSETQKEISDTNQSQSRTLKETEEFVEIINAHVKSVKTDKLQEMLDKKVKIFASSEKNNRLSLQEKREHRSSKVEPEACTETNETSSYLKTFKTESLDSKCFPEVVVTEKVSVQEHFEVDSNKDSLRSMTQSDDMFLSLLRTQVEPPGDCEGRLSRSSLLSVEANDQDPLSQQMSKDVNKAVRFKVETIVCKDEEGQYFLVLDEKSDEFEVLNLTTKCSTKLKKERVRVLECDVRKATSDFTSSEEGELVFSKGDEIILFDEDDSLWGKGIKLKSSFLESEKFYFGEVCRTFFTNIF